MNLKELIFKNIKIILTLAVVAVGVNYREQLEEVYKSFFKVVFKTKPHIDGVFSEEELATFNGIDQERLYVAVLGRIFDVTEGSKHYKKGASYNYFTGKDGSRALVTGNFKDESKNKDHVLDLTCDKLYSILHWRDTYKNKYKPVGVLIGRYYDLNGRETSYTNELNKKIENCNLEKQLAKKEEIAFPPCNMAWDADEGTRVWCTKNSGGVSRSWTGVPRQLFTPGVEKPRCACVNPDIDNSAALLKEYENCPYTSSSCTLGNN